MINNNIICVITFKQGDYKNDIENVRSNVFLDTVNQILKFNLSAFVVYTDTNKKLVEKLKKKGVVMVKQTTNGMGNVRREAIHKAYQYFGNNTFYCWLEPEKPDLVRFIIPMVRKMKKEKTAFGFFNRKDMSSYPPEQAHYYLFNRAVVTELIGFDLDYAFGPMIMTSDVINYFIDYNSKYGDKWDSILVPRLYIIKDKVKFSVLLIDFKNDKRMTDVETGNVKIILKRLEQFNNVVPSLINEWYKNKKSND